MEELRDAYRTRHIRKANGSHLVNTSGPGSHPEGVGEDDGRGAGGVGVNRRERMIDEASRLWLQHQSDLGYGPSIAYEMLRPSAWRPYQIRFIRTAFRQLNGAKKKGREPKCGICADTGVVHDLVNDETWRCPRCKN